jgi:hypothetical protein
MIILLILGSHSGSVFLVLLLDICTVWKWADMRFGTWNVRSMYRAGSLRAVAEEISKYNFDSAGVQEVRWDGGGTEPAGE